MGQFDGLSKTTNLKLNKPSYDNVADIEALNENADILDTEISKIKGKYVSSVNGKTGDVTIEKYTHPNSGVNAGTYRKVTVNAQGHVTVGVDGAVPITEGGTGASNAEQALRNLGVATQAEAEAGVIDNKIMTPLMVLQSILKNAPKQDLTPYAKLASPAFTGKPTAPTAAKTANDTQIATTAFVHALAGAVNNGGIVAQSLGPNGFVKFANGLILQWGHCDKSGAFNFPISFNNIFAAYASWSTSAKGYRTYAINICEVTNAGASVKCDNSSIGVDSVAWLALGD